MPATWGSGRDTGCNTNTDGVEASQLLHYGIYLLCVRSLRSRRRKWAHEAGNWSQRMNRRSSPNRRLIKPWWRTARAMEVLPIPPAPMRVVGIKFSARSNIFSINSSRQKKVLGGRGGDSPGTLDVNVRHCTHGYQVLPTWPGSETTTTAYSFGSGTRYE